MKKKLLIISILVLVILVCTVVLIACGKEKGVEGGGLWQGKPGGSNQQPGGDGSGSGSGSGDGSGSGSGSGGSSGGGSGSETPSGTFGTPTGLAIKDGLATWGKVNGADGYELKINETIITGRKLTSYRLLDMPNLPTDGKFVVQVRATKGDEKSDWSASVTYNHVGSAMVYPMLSYSNGSIVWSANSSATNVQVTVDGTPTLLDKATSSFALSQLSGSCTVSVKFVGDGVYVLDSREVSVVYDATTQKIHLPQPTNVKMDGAMLSFDEVLGANIYYLQDVNNTVTQTTEFTSDRSNKFLVRSVWAGNTDIDIEDSAPADVEYFSSEKGLGTESSPYLISTPAEMRYIEFYESDGQRKFYQLQNDIVLEEYSPKQDEEINNFYNLGSLSGVIDGAGYKLQNTVVYSKDGYSSIFDSIAVNGIIKNLVIDNANWRTWTQRTNDGVFHEKGGECAILAYTNRGTIENVRVTNSSVHSVQDGAAALVSVNKGTIRNCEVDSSTTIYGSNEAGGIAIFNAKDIEGCINKAAVSGNTVIGGIVGRNNGTISECGNEGVITAAKTYAGGICGYNFNIYDGMLCFESTIERCYNTGDVHVTSFGGGIVGKNGGDGINEIGQLSYANAAVFSCYNTGALYGASCLGGIVGDNYSYHETASPLGVVNCYSSGTISVDAQLLQSARVFVDASNLGWDITVDGARISLYYWKDKDTNNGWPGTTMMTTTAGGKTYFYADLSMDVADIAGMIVVRSSSSGEVWNKTFDIMGPFQEGKLLLTLQNAATPNTEEKQTWTGAASSSAVLANSMQLPVGGIAGYSNMINDCYYVQTTVNGQPVQSSVANGTQYNKIVIGGVEKTSDDCMVTAAALTSTLLAKLNAYDDVWVQGTSGPILKWQQKGE